MKDQKPIKVYVAGPFSHPDMCVNTNKTILAADELCRRGFVPYVPHLTLLWHVVSPHPYEFWLAHDLHWLRACDAVFLLPGESAGAAQEIEEARRYSIPVFSYLADLEAWRNFGGFKGDQPVMLAEVSS